MAREEAHATATKQTTNLDKHAVLRTRKSSGMNAFVWSGLKANACGYCLCSLPKWPPALRPSCTTSMNARLSAASGKPRCRERQVSDQFRTRAFALWRRHAQDRRGMPCGQRPRFLSQRLPRAPLPADPERSAEQRLRRHRAERDHHARTYMQQLRGQPRTTGGLSRKRWRACAGAPCRAVRT